VPGPDHQLPQLLAGQIGQHQVVPADGRGDPAGQPLQAGPVPGPYAGPQVVRTHRPVVEARQLGRDRGSAADLIGGQPVPGHRGGGVTGQGVLPERREPGRVRRRDGNRDRRLRGPLWIPGPRAVGQQRDTGRPPGQLAQRPCPAGAAGVECLQWTEHDPAAAQPGLADQRGQHRVRVGQLSQPRRVGQQRAVPGAEQRVDRGLPPPAGGLAQVQHGDAGIESHLDPLRRPHGRLDRPSHRLSGPPRRTHPARWPGATRPTPPARPARPARLDQGDQAGQAGVGLVVAEQVADHPVGHPQRAGQCRQVRLPHLHQAAGHERGGRREPGAAGAGHRLAAQLQRQPDGGPAPGHVVVEVAVQPLEPGVDIRGQRHQQQLDVQPGEPEAAGQVEQPRSAADHGRPGRPWRGTVRRRGVPVLAAGREDALHVLRGEVGAPVRVVRRRVGGPPGRHRPPHPRLEEAERCHR